LSPIVNVIPNGLTPERISEKFGVDGFELNTKHIANLRKLNLDRGIGTGIGFSRYDVRLLRL
jgi:diketogulonate reductase-like aldo/keto reductase